MYSELKLQYYRTVLIQTKRGNSRGVTINAKPILLIALFDHIEKGAVSNNKILFDNELKECYEKCYFLYEPEKQITPFHKPFFYLQSDGYWNLSWNNDEEQKIPSAKYLRENVKYASLDNALWDLLQDAEARSILQEAVINHFLTPKNT
jgi:putative restriction endonuclease